MPHLVNDALRGSNTTSLESAIMPKQSAGLLIYRTRSSEFEVVLVHPGGPFFKNKDDGIWSIPKGEFAAEEDPLATAQRELLEETGLVVDGPFVPLAPITQRSGKIVYAWAVAADFEIGKFESNTFSIEWPPKSGKQQDFPEVDRVEWFAFPIALQKINEAQRGLLTQLKSLTLT